jgi:hypothetical protein
VFPGLGALVGLAIDAVIPGKLRVVYQAPRPQAVPRASLMIAPSFTSHARGVVLLVTF